MAGKTQKRELPDAEKLEMASRIRREIDKEDARHEKERERLIVQLNNVVAGAFDGLKMPVKRMKRKYARKGTQASRKDLITGTNGKSHRLFDESGAPITAVGCAFVILKKKDEPMHISELATSVKAMAKSLRITIRAKNMKTFQQSLSTQLYKKPDLFDRTGRSMFKASAKVDLPEAA